MSAKRLQSKLFGNHACEYEAPARELPHRGDFEMTGKTTRAARWAAYSSSKRENSKLTVSADAPGRRRPHRCQHTYSPWCCDPDRAEDRHSPDHAHGHWKAWKGVSTIGTQRIKVMSAFVCYRTSLWRMTSARS